MSAAGLLLGRRPRAEHRVPAGLALPGLTMIVSGSAAYGYLLVTARALGPESHVNIATLWSAVFLVVTGLWSPLEQEVTRAVALERAEQRPPGTVLAPGLVIVTALEGTILLLALGNAMLGGSGAFGLDAVMLVLLAVAIGGFGFGAIVKGTLAGIGRLEGWAAFLLLDGCLRLTLTLALAVAGVRDPLAYAVVFSLTPWVATVTCLRACRDLGPFRRLRGPLTTTLCSFGFGMALLVVANSAAAVLAHGPALALASLDDRVPGHVVAAFIAGMTLARLPLFAFQAVQASLLPRLVALIRTGRSAAARRLLWHLAALVVAASLAAGLAATTLGPSVIETIFGEGFTMTGRTAGSLALATGGWLVATIAGQGLIAEGAAGRVASAWLVGVGAGAAVVVLAPADPATRVELGMVLGSVAAAVVMIHQLAGQRRRDHARSAR